MTVIRRALEQPIERRVVDAATRDLGLRSLKLNLRYDAGFPDRLFLIKGGRPAFVEFKRPGEDLKPLQRHRYNELIKLGYTVKVCDDYNKTMDFLRRLVCA